MSDSFKKLFAVNVNDHVRDKNRLTYLPWAFAWAEVKKACPKAFYTIYENEAGLNYHHDGKTAWVKTGVTIDEIELIEYLPVMDFKNKSITLNNITSFEVNKTIQRSLTKACARHGLGLYIYAGEDLPEESDGSQAPSKAPSKPAPQQKKAPVEAPAKKPSITLSSIVKESGHSEEVIKEAIKSTVPNGGTYEEAEARFLNSWGVEVKKWLDGNIKKRQETLNDKSLTAIANGHAE